MKRILYPTILFVLLELTLIFALVMWTVRSVLTRQEYEAVSRIARSTVKEMSFTGTATMVIGIVILALIMAGSTLLFVGWLRERIMHRKRAQFFQSFSHELMTPLTSLQMNADLLLEDHDHHKLTAPQVRQLVEDMRSQTRRLERRLRNIIETTRIENRRLELEKTVVDLGAWVGEFVARSSLISVTGHVKFSVETPGETPSRAAVDERYLDIVLENLLENAVKNGARHVEISVHGTGDSVEVRVSDDGGGIDPADLPSIFRLFYRGRQQTSRGSGLGLSVTRQIVRLHGGRIAATSEGLGQGAVFTITLPRAKGAS
ncbi:HAMP domain-containing histidine kinase [Myxococcota bacterium]|nr:HAMP domain-containing histidine kinase [Myxococcota bacterium]